MNNHNNMSETSFCVTKTTGEQFIVHIDIPEKYVGDENARRDYICNWIDENLENIKSWR